MCKHCRRRNRPRRGKCWEGWLAFLGVVLFFGYFGWLMYRDYQEHASLTPAETHATTHRDAPAASSEPRQGTITYRWLPDDWAREGLASGRLSVRVVCEIEGEDGSFVALMVEAERTYQGLPGGERRVLWLKELDEE